MWFIERLGHLVESNDSALNPVLQALRSSKSGRDQFMALHQRLMQSREWNDPLIEFCLKILHGRHQKKVEVRAELRQLIIEHTADERRLALFWLVGEALLIRAFGQSSQAVHEYRSFWQSILAEVAVYFVAQELSVAFQYATPDQDRQWAIDAWIGDQTALQISSYRCQPHVAPSVGILTPDFADTEPFAWQHDYKWMAFQRRVRDYEFATSEFYRPLMVILPSTLYNRYTGVPEPELIAELKPVFIT